MDYYTPLEARKMSFKEFIQDWVVKQFAEQFRDYVAHIYAKIGATSRAAAAMFAVQHGLLPEEKTATITPW